MSEHIGERKRLIFFAEGATMAHFVRLLALADTMDLSRYEIHFYAPARFKGYLQDKPYPVGELQSMPGEQFLANLSRGKPMFPKEVIRRYVAEDRAIITALKPDLVMGDMRPSLTISAHMEGVRCASLINAYWSPYATRRSIVPELPITRIIPPRWLSPIYGIVAPRAIAKIVDETNQVRKEFGMPPLTPDLQNLYTDGDYVLYPDIPEFVPTPGAPKTHAYVGICQWAPATQKPQWWPQMTADTRQKVFVSLGSSGPTRILPQLLRALARLPVAVLLSSSGRQMPPISSNVYVTKLLPFTETAALSSLVVSHGGSGGLYPAIEAGTPVLGIPSNGDQHLSTAALVESGAGLGVRVEEASEKRLHQALEKLLMQPAYKKSALGWADIYTKYDSGKMFAAFLDSVV